MSLKYFYRNDQTTVMTPVLLLVSKARNYTIDSYFIDCKGVLTKKDLEQKYDNLVKRAPRMAHCHISMSQKEHYKMKKILIYIEECVSYYPDFFLAVYLNMQWRFINGICSNGRAAASHNLTPVGMDKRV